MIELLLREHVLDEEAEHGLLDLGVPGELLEVVQGAREVAVLQTALVRQLEPWVVERLGRRGTLLRVHLQQRLDQVTCLRRESLPVHVARFKLPLFDRKDHLLVVVS